MELGKIRRRVEEFLAPENARNGVPTYIPRTKRQPVRPIDEEALREELADEHEITEEEPEEASQSREFRTNRYMGLSGHLALRYEASLQQPREL